MALPLPQLPKVEAGTGWGRSWVEADRVTQGRPVTNLRHVRENEKRALAALARGDVEKDQTALYRQGR